MKLTDIKSNPNNPRIIKDDKFKKLVKSLQVLPIMLKKRPILIDEDNMIIGGNMRHKAAQDAGIKELHTEQFTREDAIENNRIAKLLDPDYIDKTYEEQRDEMVVKDNSSFGEWDWGELANQYEAEQLDDWGIDLPKDFLPEFDDNENDSELTTKDKVICPGCGLEFTP